jgi:hypothetical protein
VALTESRCSYNCFLSHLLFWERLPVVVISNTRYLIPTAALTIRVKVMCYPNQNPQSVGATKRQQYCFGLHKVLISIIMINILTSTGSVMFRKICLATDLFSSTTVMNPNWTSLWLEHRENRFHLISINPI